MEVLDNTLPEDSGKLKNKRNLVQFIPFGIAAALVITHVVRVLSAPVFVNAGGETVMYIVVETVIYAAIGLIAILVLILLRKKIWKYTFLGLIIISFTPFIHFYPMTFYFGIGSVKFDVIALMLLIFHVVMNPDIIPAIKLKLKTSEKSIKKHEALVTEQFEDGIKNFERRFKSKQKKELEQLVSENTLVPEAVQAAKRLLTNQ